MNIYEARRLQKKLFNCSNLEFKRMRTYLDNERLFYTVIHRVSDIHALTLNEAYLERIRISMELGAVVEVRYINDASAKYGLIPPGLYIGERIEID